MLSLLSLQRRAGLRGASSPKLKLGAALAVIGLVAWTQLFLGVHELSHLGQRDASACRFALVASTAGSGDTPAVIALVLPSVVATEFLPAAERPQAGISLTQQARAPPAFA